MGETNLNPIRYYGDDKRIAHLKVETLIRNNIYFLIPILLVGSPDILT